MKVKLNTDRLLKQAPTTMSYPECDLPTPLDSRNYEWIYC